jgi:hypothetical protein
LAVVKDSCVTRNAVSKASAESSNSDAAESACQKPIEGTPKSRTRLVAVCSTPGQLNHFVALALQQQGQQSALRKGRSRGHNVVFFVFHKRLLILDLTMPPRDSRMGPSSYAFRGISDPVMSIDLFEVRPRKDKPDVDLISDLLAFGSLW